MKKTCLLFLLVTMAMISGAQTITFQGGTSISRLHWSLDEINVIPVYDEALIGYSFFVGLNYLDKSYIDLSSNIGLIRKGGKDKLQLIDQHGEFTGQHVIAKPTLDFLSINSFIDLKYPLKNRISPFLSVGARLDFLLATSNHFDELDELDELNQISIGFILGSGIQVDLPTILLGVRADYYIDLTKIAKWRIENNAQGTISVNTLTLNLTIGYKLK